MATIYPFVTLDEVVANSASLIKETDTKSRNMMRQWSYLGERQLGFSGLSAKADQVSVDNLTIRKPSDYAVGIDLALFDSSDQEYKYHFRGFKKRIHLESSFVNLPFNGLSSSMQEIGVSEDPYFFYLDSTGDGLSYANINYYAYPIDSNGDIQFPEHHLFALTMFNFWMWQKRKNEDKAGMALAKQDWLQARVEAKSKNKIPSMLEGKDIVRYHNSMIDKIFYNRF